MTHTHAPTFTLLTRASAATAAATAAVAAYLNGRYVLSNDARILWTRFSNMAYSARRGAGAATDSRFRPRILTTHSCMQPLRAG